MEHWKQQAIQFLQPYKKEKLLAAVSGGPDSMAMLANLYEAGFNIVAAHVNYHKRPTANRDEKIVEDWCQKRKIPFYKLDARDPFGNFQKWAREVRYNFFGELANEQGCKAIVLAHQQDDVLETWLMQKEKNMIPQTYGLSAKGAWHDLPLLRPFLSASKKELEDWCQKHQIPYGIDETNLQDHYRRNQLRHSILETADAQKRQELLAKLAKDQQDLEARRNWGKKFLKTHGPIELMEQKDAWFLLDLFLSEKTGRHYSRKYLEEILRQLSKDGIIEVQGWQLERYRNKLYIANKQDQLPVITIPTMEKLQEWMNKPFGTSLLKFSFQDHGKTIESISLNPEDFPLEISACRPEDEITMRFGRKKVSRALMDRKLPSVIRQRIPIIRNKNQEVIFVPAIGCNLSHFACNPSIFMVELTS